jgi:hypothetical protein
MPPSYTLTTHWLTYCTNCTHPQPPAIPDSSTFHCNNRNTPQHKQGPQNPVTPIHLPPPTQPFSHPPFWVHPY